jgi:hypothetical protein
MSSGQRFPVGRIVDHVGGQTSSRAGSLTQESAATERAKIYQRRPSLSTKIKRATELIISRNGQDLCVFGLTC